MNIKKWKIQVVLFVIALHPTLALAVKVFATAPRSIRRSTGETIKPIVVPTNWSGMFKLASI